MELKMELGSYRIELIFTLFIGLFFLATIAAVVIPSLLDRSAKKELLKITPLRVLWTALFALYMFIFVGYRIPASTVTNGTVVEKKLGNKSQKQHVVSIRGTAKNGKQYTVLWSVKENDFDQMRIGDVYDKANVAVEKTLFPPKEVNSYGTELVSTIFVGSVFLSMAAAVVIPLILTGYSRMLFQFIPLGVFWMAFFTFNMFSGFGYRIPASTVTQGVVVEKKPCNESQNQHVVSIKGTAKNGKEYTVLCCVREKDFDQIRIGDVYDKANVAVEKKFF